MRLRILCVLWKRDAGRGRAGLAGPTMCAGLAGPGRGEPGRAGPGRFRAGPYIYHEIPWSGWVGQNKIRAGGRLTQLTIRSCSNFHSRQYFAHTDVQHFHDQT